MKKILYVHGLSSSGKSHTASTLRDRLDSDVKIISPDLPVQPSLAIQLLIDICDQEDPDLVIGSSLGGMFAQKMFGIKKILINPAFHVSSYMRKTMGTIPFQNPREDGQRTFVINEKLCDKYEMFEQKMFDHLPPKEKEITWGIFGEKDDQVNCSKEYKEHYYQCRYFEGGHSMTEEEIEEVLLPLTSQVLKVKVKAKSLPLVLQN